MSSDSARLGAGDIGRRVVVRHRLPDGRATDVLGLLIAADPARLVVTDRHGRSHAIDQRLILAAKPVPDPPTRRDRPSA